MRMVFADTGYWIALANPRDELHAKAVEATQNVAGAKIITTEMVLAELLNSFSEYGKLRKTAGELAERLRLHHGVSVVPQTPEQFDGALGLYIQMADKKWSLTDCASFRVMEEEGLQAALTYDRHFVQAGFKALLR